MKHNREYEIAWQGLKLGTSEYRFVLQDDFMRQHGAGEEYKGWNAQVALRFDKHESFFMLHFDVSGTVTLPCDRCGDEFPLHLWDEFDLLVKLRNDIEEETEEEDDADVAFIPRSETVLDISNWLYEFVMLSIPLQRVHPAGGNGESGCNPEALQLLNQLSEPEDAPKNAIWKGLEALKGADFEEKEEDGPTKQAHKRKSK